MGDQRLPAGAGGFVLVLVLVMLVVLSILATTIATFAAAARDAQLQRERESVAALHMESTRSTVLYLLLTQRMTFAGLTVDEARVLSEDEQVASGGGEEPFSLMPVSNEIALDGRAYRGFGDAIFSLQDDAGRVSLNWAPSIVLERFLQRGGVSRLPFGTLRNRLLDYQDADDLARLNSLEREGYAAAGKPPPSNRALLTPLELRRIPGWQETVEHMDDAELLGHFSLRRQVVVNVNTAPAEILRALPGVDSAAAGRVVDLRRSQPFLSVRAFQEVTGSAMADENYVGLYPVPAGTLTVWVPGSGPARMIHWALTPRDDGGRPWRENYEFTVPGIDDDPGALARTPESTIFAHPLASPE